MKQIKTIVIVGLGALGTLYADAFQKDGAFDVYVLADRDRIAKYRNEPRILNGQAVEFNYVLPEDTGVTADLIIICVKSDGMAGAVDMIQNYVGADTVIISLMNGVTVEDLLIGRYGAEHVLYSVYRGDGVQNMNGKISDVDFNCIYFGSVGNPCDEEQTELLADAMQRAGLVYKVEDDMLYTYWHKFAIIVGCNQLCAILGTNYSVFHRSSEAISLAKELVAEFVPLAAAAGVRNADRLPEEVAGIALSISPDCYPSIAQDREMRRRMEADIFSGEVIRRAQKLGVQVPYNEMAYRLLTMINRLNGFEF